jgi:magnesium transporter
LASGKGTLEVFKVFRLYRAEGGELHAVESGKIKDSLWIDAVAPTPEEVEILHKEFDLDLQDVADCLDPNERSRVEIEEAYDLLVLRTLLAEERNGEKGVQRMQTMPVGIFVTKGKVITVRLVSSFSYQELGSELKHKPKIETKEELFLSLVRKMNKEIEKRVRPLERTIAKIQEEIVNPKTADQIGPQAFSLSNSLIVLNTALLGNLNAMSMLAKAKHLKLNKDQMDISEDLENAVAQLYEMTTIYREIMANILDAYESTLANNLQTVMKTLTTINLILILPLMITALFSMNIVLPFSETNPYAFYIVAVITTVAVVSLWLMFRIKRIL